MSPEENGQLNHLAQLSGMTKQDYIIARLLQKEIVVAQKWERIFQQQNTSDLDMTFEAFCELYEKDMSPRLKENT